MESNELGFNQGQDAVIRKEGNEEILNKLRDPKYLPTYLEIMNAFPTVIDEVKFLKAQKDNRQEIFEFWNQEYISELSNHLIKRINEVSNSENNSQTILEVGAGNGRLSYLLQEKIKEIDPANHTKIIAVDDGNWNLVPLLPVENIDYKEALAKYNPTIVISSWMPPETDFTKDFRDTPTVQEYILIGFMEATGEEEKTWGMGMDKGETPYEKEGFSMSHLNQVEKYQYSKIDFGYKNDEPNAKPIISDSSTCSFIREV